jgi:hypothetical protein
MAKPATTTLEPVRERRFLESLKPYIAALMKGAEPGDLAVIAHYQQNYDLRIDELASLGARRKRNTPGKQRRP